MATEVKKTFRQKAKAAVKKVATKAKAAVKSVRAKAKAAAKVRWTLDKIRQYALSHGGVCFEEGRKGRVFEKEVYNGPSGPFFIFKEKSQFHVRRLMENGHTAPHYAQDYMHEFLRHARKQAKELAAKKLTNLPS